MTQHYNNEKEKKERTQQRNIANAMYKLLSIFHSCYHPYRRKITRKTKKKQQKMKKKIRKIGTFQISCSKKKNFDMILTLTNKRVIVVSFLQLFLLGSVEEHG